MSEDYSVPSLELKAHWTPDLEESTGQDPIGIFAINRMYISIKMSGGSETAFPRTYARNYADKSIPATRLLLI